MRTKWSKDIFYSCFLVGIFVCFTPLLGIVHEYSHYAMSNYAEITSWTTTANVDRTVTAIFAGYFVEFLFVVALCLLFRNIANRGYKFYQGLAGGAFGYINSLIIYACFSKDFTVSMPEIGYSIEATILGWWIMTVPIVAFLWWVFKYQLKT